MTEQSVHDDGSAAKSSRGMAIMKSFGTLTDKTSDSDAQDENCELLVSSILGDDQNKVIQEHQKKRNGEMMHIASLVLNHNRQLRIASDFATRSTIRHDTLPSNNGAKEMFLPHINADTTAVAARVNTGNIIIGKTISRVDALVKMTSSDHESCSQSNQGRLPLITAKMTDKVVEVIPRHSDKDKNDVFKNLMSNWLRQNWTNPFPDTTSLNALAVNLIGAQCVVVNANDAQVLEGTSPEEYQRYMVNITIKKIETYLVNVRMRKWRKRIEDAFDLVRLILYSLFSINCADFLTLFLRNYIQRRPAMFLLEDSLRLYDGKELRSIMDEWSPELFASHPLYSLPLKAWKRKNKVVKSSTKEAVGAAQSLQCVTPKKRRIASPKELSAGDGLIELAMGFKIMSTCEKKVSPSDVLVHVGGMGLSPLIDISIGEGPALEAFEDDARRKMKKGTFFSS